MIKRFNDFIKESLDDTFFYRLKYREYLGKEMWDISFNCETLTFKITKGILEYCSENGEENDLFTLEGDNETEDFIETHHLEYLNKLDFSNYGHFDDFQLHYVYNNEKDFLNAKKKIIFILLELIKENISDNKKLIENYKENINQRISYRSYRPINNTHIINNLKEKIQIFKSAIVQLQDLIIQLKSYL